MDWRKNYCCPISNNRSVAGAHLNSFVFYCFFNHSECIREVAIVGITHDDHHHHLRTVSVASSICPKKAWCENKVYLKLLSLFLITVCSVNHYIVSSLQMTYNQYVESIYGPRTNLWWQFDKEMTSLFSYKDHKSQRHESSNKRKGILYQTCSYIDSRIIKKPPEHTLRSLNVSHYSHVVCLCTRSWRQVKYTPILGWCITTWGWL